MNSSENKGYLPALTGIRAAAAFLVYVHHCNFFPQESFIYRIARECHIGVPLFFVLSGFLIAHRYYQVEDFHFGRYMLNRFARIYPMYFLLTTLYFLVKSNDLSLYLANITFLRGYFEEIKFSGIPQGWSLTVEETFYLFAPMAFLFIRRHLIFLVLLPACLLLLGAGLVELWGNTNGWKLMGSYNFMLLYTFFGRATEFFTGIALALYIKNNTIRTGYLTYTGLAMIALSLYTMSLFSTPTEIGLYHPMGMAINNLLLPLSGIAVFYHGLISEKTPISWILSNRYIVLLGKSSYIFYLIHMGIFREWLKPVLSNEIVIFIAMNIISVLLFLYVEEPANRYIRKRFTRKPIVKKSIVMKS